MKKEDRLDFLISKTPNDLVPFLLRLRYIALAIAKNFPGNVLIGGGVRTALIAGASTLFAPIGFITTIAVAVSSVPLVILLLGKDVLG